MPSRGTTARWSLSRHGRRSRRCEQALDLNFGIDPPPDEIPWAIAAVRSAATDVPLWIDAGRPAAITVALEVCVRGGLVISPRRVDRAGIANGEGEGEWVMHEASLAADRALVLGVMPPLFFDALAYPPAGSAGRASLARALARVRTARGCAAACGGRERRLRGAPVGRGTAVGGHAAATTGAGARALILPVKDAACVRAVRLALGEVESTDAGEVWLCTVAA